MSTWQGDYQRVTLLVEDLIEASRHYGTTLDADARNVETRRHALVLEAVVDLARRANDDEVIEIKTDRQLSRLLDQIEDWA